MKLKSKQSDWLSPLLKEVRESQKTDIKRLQGSVASPVFMIAPPPTTHEVDQNLAWCNPIAEAFFSMMSASVPLTPHEFLVMPASFRKQTSKNFRQADAELGQRIMRAAVAQPHVHGVICVGSIAFKAYFGFGRKPSMGMLVGTPLRLAPTNFKPLIVLPDLELLTFNAPSAKRERQMSFREINQADAAQSQLLKMIEDRQLFQKIYALWQ